MVEELQKVKNQIGLCMNLDQKENPLPLISQTQQRYNFFLVFLLTFESFEITEHSVFVFVFKQNEWVISRVFQKSCGGKKVHISALPPLKDSSSSSSIFKIKPVSELSHVPCFSNNTIMDSSLKNPPKITDCSFNFSSFFPTIFPRNTNPNSLYNPQPISFPSNLQFKTEGERISVSQETGLTTDMNNEISSAVHNLEMGRFPFEHQNNPSASTLPLNSHIVWNY